MLPLSTFLYWRQRRLGHDRSGVGFDFFIGLFLTGVVRESKPKRTDWSLASPLAATTGGRRLVAMAETVAVSVWEVVFPRRPRAMS